MQTVVYLVLPLLAVGACWKPKGDSRKDKEAALAVVDGKSITAERLRAHVAAQPAALRARYGSPGAKRELLDGVIQTEVMLAEARRLGLDKDPDVMRAMNQVLISKLVEHKGAEAPAKAGPVSRKEAERYYRENTAIFQQKERVRVSQILVAEEALAEKIVAAARRAPKKTAEAPFAKLVAEHSIDEGTRERGGASGLFDRQDGRHPAGYLAGAFALENVGDVSAPIATERGFFVLRLAEKRPAGPADFEEVEGEIKMRLGQKARGERMDAWMAEMKGRAKIEVFEDRLKAVDLVTASAEKAAR